MGNIQELRKFVAPEFIVGIGARKLAPRYVHNFAGTKALVVTDPGVIEAGWVGDVVNELIAENIDHIVFDQVTPNPRNTEVMAGAQVYQQHGCDVIIAIGGGSPMDCAKGIGIAVTNETHVDTFEGVDQVNIPGPPLICIPTTSGTAADVSQFSIITNMAEYRKYAIISKTVVPDVSLIDPETSLTMDAHLTACTGMDSLVHAIEAYFSRANSSMTDMHALQGMDFLLDALPKVMENPNDLEARSSVTMGCLHAGLAFSNASLGAVHAMAHSLGGLLDLPHGECNAILLRHVVEFNAREVPERLDIVGHKFGLQLDGMLTGQKTKRVLQAIEDLSSLVGIKDKLAAKGVKISDIPDLAENALIDPCMITNPRTPNRRDIECVYEEAL
ncbi:alcohol dehydrogenase-like regulatory protein ErcA [Terasakiella sp. SH-1]|uniref:alcohol dehydrogenase-like regulatory protein ErcA n=1 Tax=Terasakiella sp. SH-1 TaxID=2560057 RepID=UPI00107383E5|nr:alcohol dehydrogenase-like regulatory protein ErcA [Terasakiella sp. SH-1]